LAQAAPAFCEWPQKNMAADRKPADFSAGDPDYPSRFAASWLFGRVNTA
jgi:hypothetical protein